MKDLIEIVKVDSKFFEITRTIIDKVDRASLENQLLSLQQTEEQYIDQLEATREKITNIKAALGIVEDNGSVTGRGKVLNLANKKD